MDLTGSNTVQRQGPDGAWRPAQPMWPHGPLARAEAWLRARGRLPWLAALLGRLDERGLAPHLTPPRRVSALQVLRDLTRRVRCTHGRYPARCGTCQATISAARRQATR